MDENLLNDLSEVEMPSLTLEMPPAAEEKPEAPTSGAATALRPSAHPPTRTGRQHQEKKEDQL